MRKYFWLWLIIGIAFLLRIWQVGQLPAMLNRDEAAVAYNAFLLSETGRDEWNRSWPVALESFGDYKLPGYSLVLIPFFKLFGLSDWVVRLPSVLAGTVLVALLYLLAKKIKLSEQTALAVSLMAAVSPVLVFYSRMAFEANLALTYLTGALLIIICLKDKQHWWQFVLLPVLLLLAVFTYNTPLLLLPLLMIFAALLVWPSRQRLLITEGILGGVLLLGIYLLLPVNLQKSGITIFTDETVWSQWTAWRGSLAEPWQSIFGSRYLYNFGLMTKNFINSFSLNFLVLRGGTHPWHSLPTTGHLAAIVYGFGLIGVAKVTAVVWAARRTLVKVKLELGLSLFLLTSLTPAIITVDAPHATRSLLFFVLFHLFAGFGIAWFVEQFFKQKRATAWKLVVLLIVAEGALHAYQLFGLYPSQQAVFQPGFEQLIKQVEREHPAEEIAIVDPAGYLYIYLAWYLKFPPETYFQTIVRQLPDLIGFRYGERLSHYHFIAQPGDKSASESVLIQWSDEKQLWQVEEQL